MKDNGKIVFLKLGIFCTKPLLTKENSNFPLKNLEKIRKITGLEFWFPNKNCKIFTQIYIFLKQSIICVLSALKIFPKI